MDDLERLVRERRAFGAALRVEVAHARGRLPDQLDRVLERQEPAVRDAAAAQLVELLADDVLHRDVRDAVVLVDVVDVDDVGMVELRADLRLVEEHLDDARIVGELLAEALDHDLLLEARHRGLPREIDLGHAADGEPPHQRVATAERHRIDLAGLRAASCATLSAAGIGAPASACAASVPSIAARASLSGAGSGAIAVGAGAGSVSARERRGHAAGEPVEIVATLEHRDDAAARDCARRRSAAAAPSPRSPRA